jgi:hypothetical protein
VTTSSDDPAGGYVTEISVPEFGDGGIQRLHSRPLEGKGETEMPDTRIRGQIISIPSPGDVLAVIFNPCPQAGDGEIIIGPCDRMPGPEPEAEARL